MHRSIMQLEVWFTLRELRFDLHLQLGISY